VTKADQIPGSSAQGLSLQTLAGPHKGTFKIVGDGPATLGRSADSDICLLDEGVSRKHATVVRRSGQWHLIDVGSSAGTHLNGVRLPRGVPAPLSSGDVIRVGPWALRVVIGVDTTHAVATMDDGGMRSQKVERAGNSDFGSRADRRLKLLIDCLSKLNTATDEVTAARTLLEPVLTGSGYARGAVLRRIGEGQDVEIVTTVRTDPKDHSEIILSRSLIQRASQGESAVLSGPSSTVGGVFPSNSISELQIHSAICVPVYLAGSVTGYLYLDARGRETEVKPEVSGFCEAAATAFGLAIANLKRADLERRQTAMQAELSAAREVQQMIFPPARGEVGFVRYAMHVKPGLFVAGDLFEIIQLPSKNGVSRIGVCLGDVSGHGVGSALMMGMSQSFLHAELVRTGDPGAAVEALNRYLSDRATSGRFLSLWVGVLEETGSLHFVDAGHGHWAIASNQGKARRELAVGGVPVGIDPTVDYPVEHMMLTDGERVVVYSDGLPEQRSQAGEQFGAVRLLEAISGSSTPQDDVQRLFSAVTMYAGVSAFDDDATAASIQFRGSPAADV
jgi:phosphoserine phosphatase RsbU/P